MHRHRARAKSTHTAEMLVMVFFKTLGPGSIVLVRLFKHETPQRPPQRPHIFFPVFARLPHRRGVQRPLHLRRRRRHRHARRVMKSERTLPQQRAAPLLSTCSPPLLGSRSSTTNIVVMSILLLLHTFALPLLLLVAYVSFTVRVQPKVIKHPSQLLQR